MNFGFWSLWARLDTAENWKYCNKIIFKCVNNTVWLIFNEKLLKSEICGFCEQYTGPTCMLKSGWKVKYYGYCSLFFTVHIPWCIVHGTVHVPWIVHQALVLKKKKKKRAKCENAKSKPHLCIDWSLGNLFTWLIWDLSVFRVWIEDFVINLWFHIYGSRNSALKNLVEL